MIDLRQGDCLGLMKDIPDKSKAKNCSAFNCDK